MPIGQGKLRVEIGYSENKGKGTFNGHIVLHWPDKPVERFYNPGEPPFRSPQEACEWANAEVQKLAAKIAHASTRNKLITI